VLVRDPGPRAKIPRLMMPYHPIVIRETVKALAAN
jgi:hypothetical protein